MTPEALGARRWVIPEGYIPPGSTGPAPQVLMVHRDHGSPAAKAVALLRNQFGGHPLHGTDDVDVTPGTGS